MSILRNIALGGYQLATAPIRKSWLRRACTEGQAPLTVLFYHRVADVHPNPWTIGTGAFRKQIDWIRQQMSIVSLDEADRLLHDGNLHEPLACITFDDGYAENCDFALPWLASQGIPATYFVSTDYVEKGRAFPHDIARAMPLPVNTPEEIRDISRDGFTIGAHTINHIDCGKPHSIEELRHEIIGGKQQLEDWIDRDVHYFAFPYGQPANLSIDAFRVCREARFRRVFSACGGYGFPNNDTFHLQRVHGDEDILRTRDWLTYGARKRAESDRLYQQIIEQYVLPSKQIDPDASPVTHTDTAIQLDLGADFSASGEGTLQ